MQKITRINSEVLYKEAKKRYSDIKNAKEGTEDYAEARNLEGVIAEYEKDHVPQRKVGTKAKAGSKTKSSKKK